MKTEELDKFQRETVCDPDSSAREWWEKNVDRFPLLSKLAKQLLCIPATSPSERVFSVSGSFVTKKRASLKPDNVNMLVFLNKNLPS